MRCERSKRTQLQPQVGAWLGGMLSRIFLQLAGSADLFSYALDDPLGSSDPTGLAPQKKRFRKCKDKELEGCEDQCGSRGVQSRLVAQTFQIRRAIRGLSLTSLDLCERGNRLRLEG